MSDARCGGTTRRDGFILVAVLVVLSLLAGLVGALSMVAHSAVEGARASLDRLADDALEDAGLALAAYQVFALQRPAGEVDGQDIRFDEAVVRLGVVSETGRVDLNGSPPALLAAAWRAGGSRSLSPDAFAARIADWRDADDEPQVDGAEADAYVAARAGYTPQNGPFRSVAEVGLVLGVTAGDVAALEPLVTVANPRGSIDPLASPAALVLALPGANAATLDRVRALRRLPRVEAEPRLAEALGEAAEYVSLAPSKAYRVRVEVLRGGAVVAATTAVLIGSVTADAVYHTVSRTP